MRTVRARRRAHPGAHRPWGMALLALVLAHALAGCATMRATVAGWSADEVGLSPGQHALRAALAAGDFAAALEIQDDDALLRALTTGATAYYSAQYARSAALLDSAALLAEGRVTTSVSRASLALVTNDLARPYEPRRTELLFVPYYTMLAYAQLGQWTDAAVEARRLSALLARYGTDIDGAERELHAAMHYLAGAAFERAGEQQSAAVAYRNARALSPAFGSIARRASRDSGDVLLIVERGFVAHRVTETLLVERPAPASAGPADPEHAAPGLGTRVRAREAAAGAAAPPVGGGAPGQGDVKVVAGVDVKDGRRHEPRHRDVRNELDEAREMRVAVAALRRSPAMAGTVRVRAQEAADAVAIELLHASADVDDASAVDARRERAGTIARELARAAARVALEKAVQDRGGDAGGRLAGLGTAFFARADVRSWHVLPRELVIVRLRAPVGRQTFLVEEGSRATASPRSATADISAGTVTLLPVRLWRSGRAVDRARCASRQHSCERE